MQPRCEQAAEKALKSPDAVRTRMPGRLPYLKICAEFTGISSGVNGSVTDATADSEDGGGTKYRPVGYTTASMRPPKLVLRSQVVSVLLRTQSTNLLREVGRCRASSAI
jgi:hypothetical protein